MASKSGPTLFEVMRRAAGPQPTPEPKTPLRTEQGELETTTPVRPPAGDKQQPAGAGPGAEAPARAPLLEFTGRQLRVSLGGVSAGVTVGVILLVVAGAYQLGHRSGYHEGYAAGSAAYEARAVDEIDSATRRSPDEGSAVGRYAVSPSSQSLPGVGGDEAVSDVNGQVFLPVPGNTYIVVQEFAQGRLEDAAHAQEFLKAQGVDTVLLRQRSGALQVLTTEGFNRKDAAQKAASEQLWQRVRALGDAYRAAGGRYGLQGYLMTYTGQEG
ncbi:MAG TPA: hypothetical protein PKK06_14760 [Phycisphaerae bacterium]|nr:hypothetical protein [Phycisphaerae bacterium]HNU46540.1 hypothetical protein [Phycisphaerae bacterium]